MAQPPGPRRQARASTQYQRQLENFTASSSASASSSSFASPSAARLASNPVGTPTEGKVAIPRLPGVAQQPPAPDRNRVNHACEPCRKRKSKCDGVHPICSRCKNQGVDCIYADGKRERLKRNVQTMAMKISVYEKLLTKLIPSQSPDVQQAIRNALHENSTVAEDDASMSDENSPSAEDTIEDENSVILGVASPLRAYSGRRKPVECVGETSTIRWLAMLLVKLQLPNFMSEEHIMSLASYDLSWKLETAAKIDDVNEKCNYFSGEVERPQLDMMHNLTSLPPKDVADLLVNAYFTTVHPLFPVLPKVRFLSRYNSYYHNGSDPLGIYPWLALLNMVLALGSLWARYTQIPTGEVEDHSIYCARSQALAQGIVDPRGYPDTYSSLEPIQLIAIRGVYQLSTYQITGAWTSVTTALKFTYNRSLNVQAIAPELSGESKQLEARVWHSLRSLGQFLCILTGYPSEFQGQPIHIRPFQTTQPSFIRSPLPLANFNILGNPLDLELSAVYSFDEEYPSSNFITGLRLDEIVSEAINLLYGMKSLDNTWAHTQRLISDLDDKLSQWYASIDPGFPYTVQSIDMCAPPSTSLTYLHLRYFSARILINKPVLCDPSELILTIPYQSEASRQMDSDAAVRCISAARQILQLLPLNIDIVELHGKTPWWCILHYIVQASSVLITELSFDEPHLPMEMDDIISQSELAIRWLSTLAGTCESASKACHCMNSLHHLALGKRERATQGHG
ncbi:hypothetical protein TEQG_04990 [Trichophyton equinum CBS 127.97]|uniref:Zn(2)-C6 fungal-type domain-containing protein n=1 Tax=Trichophyton equinum (strain ATCC MYA-4606 / CBS 127.97) TaxID=559882 RepID=F2PVR5_TRIEC|nr:hypothetical protein TEQG_04990 [Trichophyton equinum CBS 127.97]